MGKRLLYCHCAYAKVVPAEVKQDVLRRLGDSGRGFEAVPDLCELAARQDPALAEFAGDPELEIVACYPRAVRWLFHAGGQELHDQTTVYNMREESAADIAAAVGLEQGVNE